MTLPNDFYCRLPVVSCLPEKGNKFTTTTLPGQVDDQIQGLEAVEKVGELGVGVLMKASLTSR